MFKGGGEMIRLLDNTYLFRKIRSDMLDNTYLLERERERDQISLQFNGFFLKPRKGSGNRERKLETVKKIVATAKKCLKVVEK